MSGVLSALTPNSVVVLTDGAVYDLSGKLLSVRRKVATSDKVPLAVAYRGRLILGELVAKAVIDAVEAVGFDNALASLPALLQGVPAEFDLELVIAGISEGGPVHRVYDNKRRTMVDPGAMHWGFGSDGRAVTLDAIGVPPPRGEALEAWFGRNGATIFGYFRRLPVPIDPEDPNTDRQYLIGGQCDLTIVSLDGVETETLHTWRDKTGQRIDPFSDDLRAAA